MHHNIRFNLLIAISIVLLILFAAGCELSVTSTNCQDIVISYSIDGPTVIYGWAIDYSYSQAREIAMQECQNHGGDNCTVLLSESPPNSWAVAWDEDGGYNNCIGAAAGYNDLNSARDAALAECVSAGCNTCSVAVSRTDGCD